jgi:hypothetical protein
VPDAPTFDTNSFGQTYGSAEHVESDAALPDLIEAFGTDRTFGYIYAHELLLGSEVTSNQSIPSSPRTVPLYDVDGRTVVGSFTFQ